ncbi:hypothetical protein Aperf_G00000126583 [Anoplocephala perfoliata]
MTSTCVSSIRPNSSIQLNCNHLHHSPDRVNYDINTPASDEAQPIGWDRRYGVMLFSEKALLFGPFLILSADEQYILSQMPKFTQRKGKKCLYCIFEAYTAVEMGESGLRARLRDPATDQVFYFPSQYPNYVILSVLHFDGDSFNTCAVLVYKFRSAEIASQAFKMLTDTNSVPQRRKSPKPSRLEPISRIIVLPNRPSSKRLSIHRSPSRSRKAHSRPRTRQINVHSAKQPQWDESSDDSEPCERNVLIPIRISRFESRPRSSSNKNHSPRQQLMDANLQLIYYRRHSPDKNQKTNGNGASLGVGNKTVIILNGKKCPLRNVVEETDVMMPAYRLVKMNASTDSESSSSSSSSGSSSSSTSQSSSSSQNTQESIDLVKNVATEDYRDKFSVSNTETSKSTVEAVTEKRENSPEGIEYEYAYSDWTGNRSGGGNNSATGIQLSRQVLSDDEEDTPVESLINNDLGRMSPPAGFIGDGTTVFNLYNKWQKAGQTSLNEENVTL